MSITDVIQLTSVIPRLASVLVEARKSGRKTPTPDAAIYVACREMCVRLESRNANITTDTGYVTKVSEI